MGDTRGLGVVIEAPKVAAKAVATPRQARLKGQAVPRAKGKGRAVAPPALSRVGNTLLSTLCRGVGTNARPYGRRGATAADRAPVAAQAGSEAARTSASSKDVAAPLEVGKGSRPFDAVALAHGKIRAIAVRVDLAIVPASISAEGASKVFPSRVETAADAESDEAS